VRSAILACLLALGCGSAKSGVTVDVAGTQGLPIPATNVSDILVVDLSVGDAHATAVVDTGSPIVALDPSSFTGAHLPNGAGNISTLTLGALTFTNQSVVGANLIASPDPSIPIGGSLGCGILCAFAVSLDYRGSTVTLGSAPGPANVASPGTSVPFSLEGGGSETISGVPGSVVFPASRIAVSVTVEGKPYSFIVDTGSSFMLLRQALFTSLVADGRAQIGGIGTATVGQESTSAVTRLRSVVVGGEEVTGLVGNDDSSLESVLDGIASEVGHDVDGLVGGSFLREFYVTVDYPGGALVLRRYTANGPSYDSFDRVGVAVTPANGTTPATVSQVFPGTDAASKGLAVGDLVLAIDGQPLATLGSTAVNALLSGDVGSSKTLELGTMTSVSVAVDDILPL